MSTARAIRFAAIPAAMVTFLVSNNAPVRAADAAPAAPADSHYEFREQHDKDGIGKFFLDREIAQVMGHQGADWLERPEREEEEHAEALIEMLRLRPGTVVADIGAGSGYLTRRMARQVSPGGRVLAVDIQPEMLNLLTNKATKAGITNIVPVLSSATDPRLPAKSVDLALLVDVYHEFEHPLEMISAICRALKPDGRLVLVEYRGEDPAVPIKPLHKMTEAQVRKEMKPHPLTFSENIRILPRQHILVFRKATGDGQARAK